MKNQALFSSKDKNKKIKCRLLQFLFGALRVKGLELRSKGSAKVRKPITCLTFTLSFKAGMGFVFHILCPRNFGFVKPIATTGPYTYCKVYMNMFFSEQ